MFVIFRIENWRKQRKAETLEKEAANKETAPNRKGWTLEDDEEDDAEDVCSIFFSLLSRNLVTKKMLVVG